MADQDTPDDDSIPGCCNAKTRNGGRCGKLPINGTGRCRLHGGASTGPRDPSKLEGNDHAAGNPGGGAPELNMNAWIHGAFSDLDKLDQRLRGEAREKVDEHRECVCVLERSRDARPSLSEDRRKALAREYALSFYQWRLAAADTVKRGFGITHEETLETPDGEVTVERKRINPTVMQGSRLSRRQLRIGEVLGMFDKTRGPRRPNSPYRRRRDEQK